MAGANHYNQAAELASPQTKTCTAFEGAADSPPVRAKGAPMQKQGAAGVGRLEIDLGNRTVWRWVQGNLPHTHTQCVMNQTQKQTIWQQITDPGNATRSMKRLSAAPGARSWTPG